MKSTNHDQSRILKYRKKIVVIEVTSITTMSAIKANAMATSGIGATRVEIWYKQQHEHDKEDDLEQ